MREAEELQKDLESWYQTVGLLINAYQLTH
jgi:hypothetical protein